MLQKACPAGSRGKRVLTAVAAAVFRSRSTHNGIWEHRRRCGGCLCNSRGAFRQKRSAGQAGAEL